MSNETEHVRRIYDKSADICDTMIGSLRSYCWQRRAWSSRFGATIDGFIDMIRVHLISANA